MTPAEFRAIYKGLRLTQEGIAAKLDVHPATIRAWKDRGVPVMAALAIRQVEWEMTSREFDDDDNTAALGALTLLEIARQAQSGLRDLYAAGGAFYSNHDEDGCD